jgi:hypothetical protein
MGQTLYTFNGGGTTGNWNNASTWTTDPTGSTRVASRVPMSGDNVVVTNSFAVTVNSAVSATGLKITIQRGGSLDLQTSTTPFAQLNGLAGQGTLRIAGTYFPDVAANSNNFDDANTGTVEFYNWGSTSNLPNPRSGQYNNLRLLNSTTTAYTAQLDNDLLLTGGLTLTTTTPSSTTSLVNFNLGKVATPRKLTVQGDINVGAGTAMGVTAVTLPTTGSNPTVQTSHTLNAGGSFYNNGTVDLYNVQAQTALLNFTGNTDANFACNGPTDLSVLQLDKGIDSQVLLNITATVAQGGASASNLRLLNTADGIDRLNLIRGVAKLGNNITLPQIHNGSDAGTGFSIGSTSTNPTLWIDGATLTNNNANGTAVYGTFRITNGRYNNLTPDAMVVREDGQILIEGGETYVDRFRPSNTSSIHRGSFIITGGLFCCRGTSSAPRNTDYARFSIPLLTQSFRMTGGTIQVENPVNAAGMFHIGVNPSNVIVTGGTVNVVLPASNTNAASISPKPAPRAAAKRC